MNLDLNRSLTFSCHLVQRGEKKIYLSVGNSSLTMLSLPSGGGEILEVGWRDYCGVLPVRVD